MILHIDGGRWYIDVRTAETSDQVSYDLTNHVPRRLAAGRVIVVADNTKVFLSVIRKRWMKLLHEVECQRSSTLDKRKKEALQFEADQMRACTFASKPAAAIPDAHVYCLTPQQLTGEFPGFMTIYIRRLSTAARWPSRPPICRLADLWCCTGHGFRNMTLCCARLILKGTQKGTQIVDISVDFHDI